MVGASLATGVRRSDIEGSGDPDDLVERDLEPTALDRFVVGGLSSKGLGRVRKLQESGAIGLDLRLQRCELGARGLVLNFCGGAMNRSKGRGGRTSSTAAGAIP